MQIVIPRQGFRLRSDQERIIIDTDGDSQEDRILSKQEVARRLNKHTRTVDMYRHLTGEARLQSESYHGRCVIRESEYKRWLKFITSQKGFILQDHLDASTAKTDTSRLRPRQRGRRGVAGLYRICDIRESA